MFQRTLRHLKPPSQLVDGFPTSFDTYQMPPYKTGQRNSSTPTLITHKTIQEFSPSEKTLKFATKHKITFPSALRLVPAQRFAEFPMRMLLCNRHVFSYYHIKYLAQFEHPLTDKILHFYAQEKQTKPLWCYVHGSSATDGSNAVVRNTSERVVRAALFRALNAAGYDSAGKSLDGSKVDIRGTIRIAISEPKAIMKIEFERLLEYLTKLVSNAVPRLNGTPKSNRQT